MLTALMMTAALQAEPRPDLRPDLGWMAGAWRVCEPGREVAEVWTAPRLSLMTGMTVTVRGDRVGFEQSRIAPVGRQTDAPLAYFAQPSGQTPTVFRVVESGPNRVVFEQAADDDFPKRIRYERHGDALTARIEGEIGGEAKAVEWRFQRTELNSPCPG